MIPYLQRCLFPVISFNKVKDKIILNAKIQCVLDTKILVSLLQI